MIPESDAPSGAAVTQAVVLAAGYGSRLAKDGTPKPLVTVGGAPLIEHAVRQCAAAGARDIVVVTGHDAVRVEAV
ncbi:MAG: NTP transferase domain-containing protein, partial [Pontixanthobacter sp.]